jgi:hypothetical protein
VPDYPQVTVTDACSGNLAQSAAQGARKVHDPNLADLSLSCLGLLDPSNSDAGVEQAYY